MTRRQNKPPGAADSHGPGDQHRPKTSRARPSYLPPMDDTQVPHPHEPVPPTVGLSRPKMDKPRPRQSNSGNSLASEAHLVHGHPPARHASHRAPSDATLHLPHIENKGSGQRPGKKQLPKIEEIKGHKLVDHVKPNIKPNARSMHERMDHSKHHESTDSRSFQLPSLTGKVPAPPDSGKPCIPRTKAFAHSHHPAAPSHSQHTAGPASYHATGPAAHHVANPASQQAPSGRRFKTAKHAQQVAVTGMQPAPPPPRPADHIPAAAAVKPSKVPSPEGKVSDHMISGIKEKIILSPNDLRVLSPASTDGRLGCPQTGAHYEIIKSPSCLEAASSNTVVYEKIRRSPPSLIDVNIQPSQMSLAQASQISLTSSGSITRQPSTTSYSSYTSSYTPADKRCKRRHAAPT